MKKFLCVLLSVVSAVALCLCFGACDKEEPSAFVGEWKLYSLMSSVQGFEGVEYKVDDEVGAGLAGNEEPMVLTSEYASLKVNEDGTFVWKNGFTLAEMSAYREVAGTWTESSLSTFFELFDGVTYTAKIQGERLVLSYDGDVTKFDRVL